MRTQAAMDLKPGTVVISPKPSGTPVEVTSTFSRVEVGSGYWTTVFLSDGTSFYVHHDKAIQVVA